MLHNAELLAPHDGREWRELRQRVSENKSVSRALAQLDVGRSDHLPRKLVLEGKTHADCLIECEEALIWIEGKRFDWLSPSIKWDVTRDQLARNLEAVWSLAINANKDYCLIICHEHPLKHHEKLLVEGYRSGTWTGGWPHIPENLRREFGKRIGTATWQAITDAWPSLRELSALGDLESAYCSTERMTEQRHRDRRSC
jgi:hypothetical protein